MIDYGQMRDEELAGLAQAGDDRAFETLFDRHAPTLRRQIDVRLPRLLRRKVDASDIVQMAYIGVHGSLDKFESRGDGSYRAWLDQIVEQRLLTPKAAYGFWAANADGDDIIVYDDELRTRELARLHTLRQQVKRGASRPHLALADFIAPRESGLADFIGAFVVTAGL